MKQFTLILAMFLVYTTANAYVVSSRVVEQQAKQEIIEFDADLYNQSMESFLEMTPKKYRKMTGKRLGLKNAIGLKLAQRRVKKMLKKQNNKDEGGGDIPKGLFIVCAILVPIAAVIFMGVMDDWEGKNWWMALILYALCYIPGLIYTLTKVKDYY